MGAEVHGQSAATGVSGGDNGVVIREAGGGLDLLTKQIIEQLQEDGRRSYAAIARVVGLSEAATRQRVQRLLDEGIVQIAAITDAKAVGFNRMALLGINTDGDTRKVAEQLTEVPEAEYVVICAGQYDLLVELVCEDDDHLVEVVDRSVRTIPGVARTETFVYLKIVKEKLPMGNEMTDQTEASEPLDPIGPEPATIDPAAESAAAAAQQAAAKRHLWMHFTRMSAYAEADIPVIVKGEGPWVWDSRGRKYLDGLSGLFVVQAGHGRSELADAAARQAKQLAYFPLWSYAHPNAIELAERLAALAPGDLNRIFFTTGGGEAVETAWKLARLYFRATWQPNRYKVLSRDIAYHGTTMGALSITGVPSIKAPYEPLVPGAIKVANTNFYRAPEHGDDLEAFGQWAAADIERRIEMEGPDTVAAVFLEPVQNSGGCFPPPPGYFQKVREICDRHGVLLVSDEVICAFGRLGTWFGAQKYGYQPDMITCAKGMTSGYSPLGAVLVDDRLMEPFLSGAATFTHGFTFGGHPVSTAVALANLDIFEKEDLIGGVDAKAAVFRAVLEGLRDLPIVGDVRGEGFFYGIELVKDKGTKETFDDDESERLLRGFLSGALFNAGLVCRADDRGDPVIQLAPPLICEQEHFDLIGETLRSVLSEAWTKL